MSSKVDVNKLLQKHGITQQEVLEWAKQYYPEFTKNFPLVAKLYLKYKGVQLPITPPIKGEVKQITELVLSEYANIRVVVIDKVAERVYMGCPQCFRKLDTDGEPAPGTPVICPYCNESVNATKLAWRDYQVGDPSGEIIVSIPPRLSNIEIQPGMVLLLRGILQDDETFQVLQVNIIREKPEPVSAMKEAAKAIAQPVVPAVTKSISEEVRTAVAAAPKAEAEVQDLDRAIRYVMIRAALNKPVEEAKAAFEKEYPHLKDLWDDILKKAGVKVVDGKLYKEK